MEQLRAEIPRNWPDPTSDFWLAAERAFERHGVTETRAWVALDELLADPIRSNDQLIGRVIGKDAGTKMKVCAPLEEARAASKGCELCGGDGWVSGKVQANLLTSAMAYPDGTRLSCSLPCSCPMGSYNLVEHRKHRPHSTMPQFAHQPWFERDEPTEDEPQPATVRESMHMALAGAFRQKWRAAMSAPVRQQPKRKTVMEEWLESGDPILVNEAKRVMGVGA